MERIEDGRGSIVKRALLVAVAIIAGVSLHSQEVVFRSSEKDLVLEGIAWPRKSGSAW